MESAVTQSIGRNSESSSVVHIPHGQFVAVNHPFISSSLSILGNETRISFGRDDQSNKHDGLSESMEETEMKALFIFWNSSITLSNLDLNCESAGHFVGRVESSSVVVSSSRLISNLDRSPFLVGRSESGSNSITVIDTSHTSSSHHFLLPLVNVTDSLLPSLNTLPHPTTDTAHKSTSATPALSISGIGLSLSDCDLCLATGPLIGSLGSPADATTFKRSIQTHLIGSDLVNMTSSHLKEQPHPDCQVSLSQSMIGTAVSSSTNHLYGTAIRDMNSGGNLLCQNSSFPSCRTDLSHLSPSSTNQADQTELPLLRFYRSIYKGCSSIQQGGAIFSNRSDTHIQIQECSFDTCKAQSSGGACFINSTANSISLAWINSSSFVGCSAGTGGSVYFNLAPSISVANSIFLDSLALYHGGALNNYIYGGDTKQFEISNCLFQNCRMIEVVTSLGGGAIFVSECTKVEFSHLQFRKCSAGSSKGHDIEVYDKPIPTLDADTIFECYSHSDYDTNLVYIESAYPNPRDRSDLLLTNFTALEILSISATTIGDSANLVVRVDKPVEGRLLVLLSNVEGGRQPGSTELPNIARLVTFDLSSSMTGSCSVQIGENGLLQRPLNDYEVTAASLSGHLVSFDGVRLPIPRTLESVECTLDEGETTPTISFRGENFPDGQYKVILHDKSSIEVEFSTDTDGSLIASCHLDEVGGETQWKEGSVWVVTGVECVDDPSISVLVDKTLYFTIPVLPSEVTGVDSPSLNKKKTEVSFEIVGSGFPSSITSVSLKRGERTITATSATMTSSTSISATFPASFTEDDNSCQFGETYTLDSIAASKTITVPSGVEVTIPSPPTITSITTGPSSSPNEFVLKMEGTNLPANAVFLAQIDSFTPIRVTMSGDGTSGVSEVIRAGQSHTIQFDTSYTVKTLRKEGDEDEHILLTSSTFTTPLGPTLTSISCPLSASDPNFVVLTVGGLRMTDGQYFVVVQKDSDEPITIEIAITSNSGVKSLLAFGSGVLEYASTYSVTRMWSESVEVKVDTDLLPFTVGPAPARIESALCVLSVESDKKEAKMTLSGSNLPLNKAITIEVKPLSSDGLSLGSPITFDSLFADTASIIVINIDMYTTQPKVKFGMKYEVTSVVITDTLSVLNPKIQFSLPIEPVRVTGVTFDETGQSTNKVTISGSGFIAAETYSVLVTGAPSIEASGSSHSQTVTVVASGTTHAVSSSIVLGNDDSSHLRFGYTYTIRSITNGTDTGFVEGTRTFTTPGGPTLTSISCPLSASDPNFVDLTVGGDRLADGLYSLLLQKGSEPSFKVEIQVTSNTGVVSLLAFGSGVLKYSGVYDVTRMWSESVEVKVDDDASSFTVDDAPARIESALCVLSVESEKKEAKLTLTGSSLPVDKAIKIEVKPVLSDGQSLGSPSTFDSLLADTASTIVININMYAAQPKLKFGTKYEVTSLEIDETLSVVNPKIQFSVPIEPVRVKGVSIVETPTTVKVKISGSGFIVDETYKMEVSGTPLSGSGSSHSQNITVVASDTTHAASSAIVLGNDNSAVLRFGFTYTILSITNGTDKGYVEGTPTFETPSLSLTEPHILSASVETNGQKTRMWIVLSGENLLQDSRFTLTLNDSVTIGGVMISSSEGRSEEVILGFPDSLSFSSKYAVTSISNSEGIRISSNEIEIPTPSKPTELTLFVCSDVSDPSDQRSGTEASSCLPIERAWEIAEILQISKTKMDIVESAELLSPLDVSSIVFNLMSGNTDHSELTLLEPSNPESALLRVNENGECKLTLLSILVKPSSPSFVFISAEKGSVTIQFSSISSTPSTHSINEELYVCSWSNGLLHLTNTTTVLSSVTMKNVVQGGIVQKGGELTISSGIFSNNGPTNSVFPSARQNVHCEEEGSLTIDKSSVEDTASMWIDIGDCILTGTSSILASHLFVPSLNADESKSAVSKTDKSISLTLKGEMLIPCGLSLEVFEWNKAKDEKGKSEIVELSTNKTTKWTETEIVAKLSTETDVKNFSSSLEWRGRLVFGDGVEGSEWMVISGSGSGNKAEGGAGSKWWLPVIIVLACAVLISLVIALICCRRRQKTKLLLSNQELDGQQMDEMMIKDDDSHDTLSHPHSTDVSLIAAGTMRPDQDLIFKTEETGLTAIAPSSMDAIPRGLEIEAVRCEEPFETVLVNGTDTLFNRLHKSDGHKWEKLKWKVAAHSLTKGLIHLWKQDAHSDVLSRLNPHNVVLDVDNTPCLVLSQQTNTQPSDQFQTNHEEKVTQKDTENKQSFGGRQLNGKKNEESQRWEAPEVTRTVENLSKNGIDQAKACVFSLGLVMWEMATQLVPFGEIDGVNAHRQIGSGVTPRMDKLADTAEGELIVRCLALNPKERPTLIDVKAELEELLKKKEGKVVEEKACSL